MVLLAWEEKVYFSLDQMLLRGKTSSLLSAR